MNRTYIGHGAISPHRLLSAAAEAGPALLGSGEWGRRAPSPPGRRLLASAVGGVAPRGAAVSTERVMLGATARRLASFVLVDARGADDGEPPQQLAGGAAERNHGEAAHDARLDAREPALHALEAERAVVLVGFSEKRAVSF